MILIFLKIENAKLLFYVAILIQWSNVQSFKFMSRSRSWKG